MLLLCLQFSFNCFLEFELLKLLITDASARPFYEPVMLTEFIAKYLNLRELSKPLSDAARLKVFFLIPFNICEIAFVSSEVKWY